MTYRQLGAAETGPVCIETPSNGWHHVRSPGPPSNFIAFPVSGCYSAGPPNSHPKECCMHRVLALVCFLSLFTAVAQAADAPIKLPADASRWINSPPVTLDSLKGKAVVLY